MNIPRRIKRWLRLEVVGIALIVVGAVGESSFFTFVRVIGIILTCLAGIVLMFRAAQSLMRRLVYRLSWRLAFSYFLIGVLPVPLLALLLGFAAMMTIGQFEANRVGSSMRQLALEMITGDIPGVLRARVLGGKVTASQISVLSRGEKAPAWLAELHEPRFVGMDQANYFAITRRQGTEIDITAVPLDDIFIARLAERSGVALARLSSGAEVENKPSSISLNVSDEDKDRVHRQTAIGDFIYPSDATAADRSSSLLRVVSWFYTSAPIVGRNNSGKRIVAFVTRLSWRRSLSMLFSQEAIEGKGGKLALIFISAVGGMLLFVCFVALVVAFVLVRAITNTVNRLSRATKRIADGDFSVRIATKARDQVGDLARSFDSMAGSLESTIRDRAAKEILDREIEQAQVIARRLLPGPDATLKDLALRADFAPVAAIGGDYYDYLTDPSGRSVVAIGDVSGHGLPTALLVAAAKAAIETLLASGIEGPELFAKLNALLYRSTDTRNYMTCTLVKLIGESTAELINAGHPAPYRISRGKAEAVALPSFPLGLFAERQFPATTFSFEPGDRLVLFTDGAVECHNHNDDAFGYERLEQLLTRHAGDSLPDLLGAIRAGIAEHCGDEPFDDDRTIVLVERTAQKPQH